MATIDVTHPFNLEGMSIHDALKKHIELNGEDDLTDGYIPRSHDPANFYAGRINQYIAEAFQMESPRQASDFIAYTFNRGDINEVLDDLMDKGNINRVVAHLSNLSKGVLVQNVREDVISSYDMVKRSTIKPDEEIKVFVDASFTNVDRINAKFLEDFPYAAKFLPRTIPGQSLWGKVKSQFGQQETAPVPFLVVSGWIAVQGEVGHIVGYGYNVFISESIRSDINESEGISKFMHHSLPKFMVQDKMKIQIICDNLETVKIYNNLNPHARTMRQRISSMPQEGRTHDFYLAMGVMDAFKDDHTLTFGWVKGHADSGGNKFADQIAFKGRKQLMAHGTTVYIASALNLMAGKKEADLNFVSTSTLL